jgi:hypothetical protein
MTFYHGKDRYALPAAITEAQIADAINGFAESAGRARRQTDIAGYQSVAERRLRPARGTLT